MGPLAGFRVVEFAGIGPGPMAAMMLADMGATVLRIERPVPSQLGVERPTRYDFTLRGRRSVMIDLKRSEGIEFALSLVERADALIEGFRPGTMERLGLGPDACHARNEKLVYGRVTGWGQQGPLAHSAGHDINYIALSGVLDSIGREGHAPTPPLNIVGDYGGAAYLCMGMLAARIEALASGQGQVIDAAMIDASASLMTAHYGFHAAGIHDRERGRNLLDSGAPFYDVYACADGCYVSIAPIERKFREQLFAIIGVAPEWVEQARDRSRWPALRELLQSIFRQRTRDEWCALLEGSDACFAPVLSMAEAPGHGHQSARDGFVEIAGELQPAPAPRFSRTPSGLPTPPEEPGATADLAMMEWGYSPFQIASWRAQRALV